MLDICYRARLQPQNGDRLVLFKPDQPDFILLESSSAEFPRIRSISREPFFDTLKAGASQTPSYATTVFEITDRLCRVSYLMHIGMIDEQAIWGGILDHIPDGIEVLDPSTSSLKQLYFIKLRKGLELFNAQDYSAATRARMLSNWRRRMQYCPSCRSKLVLSENDCALICTSNHCQEQFYPPLAPAIIVAVERGREILLVKTIRNSATYSLVAGFVESGESIESAVHREIREETNIEVEQVQYIHSQSWPFPNTLMLGFRAKYKAGELQVQDSEILDADWYAYNDLPPLPPPLSISGSLIQNFVNRMKDKH